MMLTTVPFASLRAPKDNPRKSFDKDQIAGLARSIHADGLLQNLVVQPAGEGAYRVTAGKRRYLALRFLRKQGTIDDEYPVPVTILDEVADADALRLATVENVQREQLHPMDEAEAFARILQSGATLEVIVEKSGLSSSTIRRRLALASLCSDVKKALRSGDINLAIAEALTLGTPGQQRAMLESVLAQGLDPDDVRFMLIEQKASVAMAIFPREQYTGTLTTDLFGDEETTYFDDVDQFLIRQKEAVDALAEERRKTTAWVDVLNLHSVPWWQYRTAEPDEPAGTVINLHPTGAVEVRDGLARHEVEERVVETTRASPIAPHVRRERPPFTAELLRYVGYQRSAAVQATLLEDPRKGKEAAAVLLLLGLRCEFGVRLKPHACHAAPAAERLHRGYRAIEAAAAELADQLRFPNGAGNGHKKLDGVSRLTESPDALDVWDAVTGLSDPALDRLIAVLPVLCLGQQYADAVDGGDSLFNRIAVACGASVRAWWQPDTGFLTLLTREQLLLVAGECGAAEQLTGMNGWTKKRLVEELSAYFAKHAGSDPSVEADSRAGGWTPGLLRFPAQKTLNVEKSA